MSGNALPTNIDVTQLVQNIREQVSNRSGQSSTQRASVGVGSAGLPTPAQLPESLRATNDEIEGLSSQIKKGEPPAASDTLRSRIGSLVKHRLYRFLWWQSYQIKSLAALTARRGAEELVVLDGLSQSIRQLHQAVSDCKRQVHESESRLRESESRLRQLESAQLKLQAAEIERNVRKSAADGSETASLRQELIEVKNALDSAEARMADKIVSENATFLQRTAEIVQRLEGEIAQKEQMAARTSELAQRLEAEIGQREQAATRTSELAQRFEAETGQKEQLAARLSELGLFTHQTRAALSIQDRRLALFIEEARKRLPDPFTGDQLQQMIDGHTRHRYDSVYAAFEDVFRGSREEIKARQSVYLPLLKERLIGSSEMPILDLGCGRGEWLELLGEQGFEARGLDRDEMMVERCKSAGLEVIQGEALAYLGSLPDASLGAVTSFHMIEHVPFEVVLALVDETLRVLRPGGVLILETPNPQNILVGAHTFYLDPTHLKPLPSPMLRFFVEARGFCDAHVRELHPYPETVRFADDGKGMASRLNDYLYGPQDYAVIGRKAPVG